MKLSLFAGVAKLINAHKLYSFSIAVSQDEFKNRLGEAVRRTLTGLYALAFFTAVLFNRER